MFRRFRHIDTKTRPLIIAHRGARKIAPENTCAAFKKAVSLSFDGVEMDVVLTKDKVPVIFHGNDLSKYTRAKGLIHETLSYDLAKIDAGSLFSPRYEGEKIPTLSEVLELLSDSGTFIDIELKSQPRGHTGIEETVAEMVYHYQLYDRVMISSFSPLILRRFARISPKIPTALLVGPHPFFFLKTLLSANMLNVSAINPIFQDTTETLVGFAHNRDWKVFVWAVNTQQEFMRAVELGVDGIITDEPELLKIKV